MLTAVALVGLGFVIIMLVVLAVLFATAPVGYMDADGSFCIGTPPVAEPSGDLADGFGGVAAGGHGQPATPGGTHNHVR